MSRRINMLGATNLLATESNSIFTKEDGTPIIRETTLTQVTDFYLGDNVGNARRYRVESPIGIVPEGVCFWLHGAGGSGDGLGDGTGGFRVRMDFDSSFKQNYVNVYPTAAYNPVVGIQTLCWNAGTPFEFSGNPDDVAFLNTVVTEVVQNYSIDPTKIIIGGLSAGGMMSIYYASEAFRQNFTYKPSHVVVISGVIAFDYVTYPFSFTGKLLDIHSDQDTIVPIAGGGFGSYMTQAEYFALVDGTVDPASDYIWTTYGQHNLPEIRIGLANETPPLVLQTVIEDFIA